ncbi:COG1361 family protein [Frigoriglobus tundricola]|uniref:Methylamine utilization protein MauE n=1 Tax=Frigoriglobus tundricola TaxID=2774151 RepID=A0A6M5Z1Y1_9BACT|nr:hypothetical protein [Frigoriglobus tundricola]QJW99451.1 hypothetical protein FTUN_7063 [Frigoriglobus tundricola]
MRRAIAVLISCLLLTTAALKVYGLSITSPVQSTLWTDGRVRFAVILWEAFLGLWLLTGIRSAWSWVATVVTFIGFTAVSGTLGVQGVSSCGCLGAVKASPLVMFAVDLLVLGLLLFRRPAFADLADVKHIRLTWSVVLPSACAALLLAVAWGVQLACHGSVEAAVAHARDELVFARQSGLDFGPAAPNSTHEGVIEIVNLSAAPVRVFGGSTGCGYYALGDCPGEIPAGGVGRFRIKMSVPERAGPYRYDVTFWVSGYRDSTYPVPVVLTGSSRID